MKSLFTSCLIFTVISLLPVFGFAQKSIELPSNRLDTTHFESIKSNVNKYKLDDLTKTQDAKRVRIWMEQHVVEFTKNKKETAKLTTYISSAGSNQSPVFNTVTFDSLTAKKLTDSLLSKKIFDLPDEQFTGIDGQQYLFEVSTPANYRLFSYWSPSMDRNENSKQVADILSAVHNILDFKKLDNEFLKKLKPGKYQWGMTTINVDYFLPDEVKKSTLYEYVQNKLRTKSGINNNTSPLNFPSILIDHQYASLRDLNLYEYSKMKSVTILPKNNETNALYGSSGQNGMILINTK